LIAKATKDWDGLAAPHSCVYILDWKQGASGGRLFIRPLWPGISPRRLIPPAKGPTFKVKGIIMHHTLRRRDGRSSRDENRAERARIRDHIQEGMRDPELFLDLARERKNTRRLLESGHSERQELLEAQKQKVASELRNTRDLDGFIEKTSRSKTLYALVAMALFRHVRSSEAFRGDHRYKLAIVRAMEEPGLAKAIRWKWDTFDKEFPGRAARESW
jgi:hypothetical protein